MNPRGMEFLRFRKKLTDLYINCKIDAGEDDI
jgi:hypothetical protein